MTAKTFASLRFKGDRLEPSQVTEILDEAPTTAYRKGEIYKRSRGQEIRGRTGLWLLSSRGHIQSEDLNDHLKYLVKILFPGGSQERVERLHHLMRDGHVEADVGCFWQGGPGASPPTIAQEVRKALKKLPAEIETDFQKAA